MRIVKTPQLPSRKVCMKRLSLGWPGACHSAWLLLSNQSSFPSRPVHEHALILQPGLLCPHIRRSASSQQGWESVRPGTEPNGSNGQKKTDWNRSNIPNLGPISEDWAHALQNWKACKSACGFKMLQTTWNCLKLIDCFWAQHSNNLPLPNQSYKKKSWHLRSICWVGSLKGWPPTWTCQHWSVPFWVL